MLLLEGTIPIFICLYAALVCESSSFIYGSKLVFVKSINFRWLQIAPRNRPPFLSLLEPCL